MKAYELTNGMLDTLDIFLESGQGELDIENYNYMMGYLKEELKNKSSSIIKYIRNLELECEMAKMEIERLDGLRKIKNNKIASIKKYLTNVLVILDKKKIDTDLGSYGLRKSTKLEVYDEAKIPNKFLKIKQDIQVDKLGITSFIKTGGNIEGARLIENYSLQIR